MPTKSELIESLRDGFVNLGYGDDAQLSQLLNRGEMILRRTYGTNSPYYTMFLSRAFTQLMPELTPEEQSDSWESDQRETINMLETMLEEIDLDAEEQGDGSENVVLFRSDRVFVVHGHDEAMRESVARALSNLGLEPIILHEQSDHGRTIIEKFYDYSDVGFAVVLLSPDDIGYANNADPDTAQPRARQNVILELGFFLGKLGRENVAVLHKGNVEIPSDFSGILYTPYDPSGAWPYKLTRELRESGYKVSADDL
jgi:predicted nucleotide-binding protein